MQDNPSELSSHTSLTSLMSSSTISYLSGKGSGRSADIVSAAIDLGGYLCLPRLSRCSSKSLNQFGALVMDSQLEVSRF